MNGAGAVRRGSGGSVLDVRGGTAPGLARVVVLAPRRTAREAFMRQAHLRADAAVALGSLPGPPLAP